MDHHLQLPDVDKLILVIRGQSVILDRDLARIYGVSTARLNEQVTRNMGRFPADFMFQLTKEEMGIWISQFATSNPSLKMGLRKPPRAFTEHGAVMLAAVLKSPIAVAASIEIVRAFNRMRRMIAANLALAGKLAEIELRLESHDDKFHKVFEIIRRFLEPPPQPPREIGFKP
jgi:hypothetical protein